LGHRFGETTTWGAVPAIGDTLSSIYQWIPAVGWFHRIEMVVMGAASVVDLDVVKATEAGQMVMGIFASITSLNESALCQSTSVLSQQAPPVPSPSPIIAPSGPSSDGLFAQVNALSERPHQLEAYTGATSVKSAHVGVTSLGYTRAWSKTNFPSGRFGLIPDIFTYLEHMTGNSDAAHSKRLV
jgi:hypothetical protein